MSTLKIKGNWNQQKGKLKQKFSNIRENDDSEVYMVEEELAYLRNMEKRNSGKKKTKQWN